jgi:FixJ family two-component response regulator
MGSHIEEPRCGPRQGVVLVDDDPDIARWLAQLFEAYQVPFRWVGSGEELLKTWSSGPQRRREVVLLDLALPGMSGITLLETHVPSIIDTPVLVFTGSADVGGAVRAMKAGAHDLIEKPPEVDALFAALRKAFADDAAAALREAEAADLRASVASLTPRERELLGQLVHGRTNQEMSVLFGISPRTVEIHRARIFSKTRSDSATDLVHRLWRLGLAHLVERMPSKPEAG